MEWVAGVGGCRLAALARGGWHRRAPRERVVRGDELQDALRRLRLPRPALPADHDGLRPPGPHLARFGALVYFLVFWYLIVYSSAFWYYIVYLSAFWYYIVYLRAFWYYIARSRARSRGSAFRCGSAFFGFGGAGGSDLRGASSRGTRRGLLARFD